MFGNLIYTISMQTFFSNPQYQGMIQVKNKFGQIRLLLKVRPRLQFPYFFLNMYRWQSESDQQQLWKKEAKF